LRIACQFSPETALELESASTPPRSHSQSPHQPIPTAMPKSGPLHHGLLESIVRSRNPYKPPPSRLGSSHWLHRLAV
jgi:hypothetical protein